MEHPLFYPVKRVWSLFRGFNFQPLILRTVWGINVLLFAIVVWAFVSSMRNFD